MMPSLLWGNMVYPNQLKVTSMTVAFILEAQLAQKWSPWVDSKDRISTLCRTGCVGPGSKCTCGEICG